MPRRKGQGIGKKRMEPKQTNPRFGFVSRDENPQLYKCEEQAHAALEVVVAYRENVMDEDRWGCAVPEALFNMLDLYGHESVRPAVLHWVHTQLDPALQRFANQPDWELLDALKELIAGIELRFKRGP